MQVYVEDNSVNIIIDGNDANTLKTHLYRGAGMVSGNNSSRLLLDYKAQNPDKYWEILKLIFGVSGVEINHLKLEMGSDINSSSGTEPGVKRTVDEVTDVTRGAGYQLAADAKTINPALTLDMLYWSEPLWVTESGDVYGARYKWYRETLIAAYYTYGLKFDYVSAVRNEKPLDADWIKYLAKNLDKDKTAPYDFSAIKIVAADEVCGWEIADKMLADEELMSAVDVLGSHYTSHSSENAKKLSGEYGKELWLSEGCPPMSYAKGTYRFDGTGSGISDINGLLDIANRIITMYPCGAMTLYEYQPVAAAYYDGAAYCHKQLITANQPWNGYYYLESGFFMSLHFSQFIKKGWAFIDKACYADGAVGGDGHAIVDAKYSYITAADTNTGDYTTVIANTTDSPITYCFAVLNLKKAGSKVNVWETRGPDDGAYNENYYRKTGEIIPFKKDGKYIYSVVIKPYSLVTVSTFEACKICYAVSDESLNNVMALPYYDDFEYSDKLWNFLSLRGNAPLYTTDQGGAFEVWKTGNGNVLMQMITPEIKAEEWGVTPEPVTTMGDDRWFNYSLSVDIGFSKSELPGENYAGAGLRYNLAALGESGYWLQLYENGCFKLKRNKSTVAEGQIEGFDSKTTSNVKIEANGTLIKAYINGELLAEYEEKEALLSAGRGALYSSYNKNFFDNLEINAIENTQTNITRYDDTDTCVNYTGKWEHNTMSSFKNYKRTISTGSENAAVTIDFEGTGIGITGENKESGEIAVKLDGMVIIEKLMIKKTGPREICVYQFGLEDKSHTIEITILSGKFAIDGVEAAAKNSSGAYK